MRPNCVSKFFQAELNSLFHALTGQCYPIGQEEKNNTHLVCSGIVAHGNGNQGYRNNKAQVLFAYPDSLRISVHIA
jgi:hypothetical protein